MTASYEENLKDIPKKNLRNIVIGQLTINSLRNKFDLLAEKIKEIINVLVISETKLDEFFPVGQFRIPGYTSPFLLDCHQHGGGIMAFIREDIPAKFYSTDTKPIEGLYIELNFRKRKWLLSCSYNPNKNKIMNHLDALRRNLDLYPSEYEHVTLLGDFNVETKKPCMQSFLELYGFRNLISEPTCYKNPEKPSSIDLILTNSSSSFQNSCAIETGLSDFHKMVITVMKTTFQRLKPKLIYYRDYSVFSNDKFREELLSKLSMENISNTSNGLEKFLQICTGVLDKLPLKRKNTIEVIICLL